MISSKESRGGRHRLLSYDTEPVRRQLDGPATQELKAFALAQIRLGLPWAPD